jgi:hypothetical protein
MKLNVSPEWCLKMAELEGDQEVGAGILAADPTFWFVLADHEIHGLCATEGCEAPPSVRLEVGGVGSNYCSACREKIESGVCKR